MILQHKSIITEIERRPCPKGMSRARCAAVSFVENNAVLEIHRRKITNEEINRMPARQYEGEIFLVEDEEAFEAAVEILKNEDVLGFDTETRPVFSKGKSHSPSILQLAAAERVYIFQFNKVPFDGELARILENPAIVKAGVAVRDDIRELQRLHHFNPAGFVDLSQVAKHNKLETHGLRNLAANFFDLRIPKGARCSNWAVKTLAQKQLLYAATDAWIGRELYFAMRNKGLYFN